MRVPPYSEHKLSTSLVNTFLPREFRFVLKTPTNGSLLEFGAANAPSAELMVIAAIMVVIQWLAQNDSI